ncbi:MAG TPA: hypothetical protein VEC36_00310 [Patescibacteria group bacterium]|nr:hypothetical protein [Patescibacteria group bacterium]
MDKSLESLLKRIIVIAMYDQDNPGYFRRNEYWPRWDAAEYSRLSRFILNYHNDHEPLLPATVNFGEHSYLISEDKEQLHWCARVQVPWLSVVKLGIKEAEVISES